MTNPLTDEPMDIKGGLILDRKVGQEIWLEGGRIKIRVIRASGSWAKFQIQADREIQITRPEFKKKTMAQPSSEAT